MLTDLALALRLTSLQTQPQTKKSSSARDYKRIGREFGPRWVLGRFLSDLLDTPARHWIGIFNCRPRGPDCHWTIPLGGH
jgi:hypothetical protein